MKLTNKQLEVLSESIVNKLQELHTKEWEDIKNSEEYKNITEDSEEFSRLVKNVKLFEECKSKLEELRKESQALYEKLADTQMSHYSYYNREPENLLESYINHLRNQKYPQAKFDKEKMLTEVQADLLMSDLKGAKEAFDITVEKFK